MLEKRLTQVEAVVQNQDNREHDLLDSDDYYQFEGGMVAGRPTLPDPFEIEPPLSASEGLLDPQELLVVVSADGRLALDGTVMPEDRMKSSVADRLSVSESVQVRLKADAQVQATQVIAVMELLREAGVDQLKLLTVQGSN